MNYSTAVFLINKDLRAVLAVYEGDMPVGVNNKKVMFKTLDKTIKKDDFVVIPTNTRHGMTVVKVTDVDVNVDFDDPTQVAWIITKLDLQAHKLILEMELQAIETIKKAEFRKRRQTLLTDLVADQEEIKSLPMYANGDHTNATSK